MSRVKEQAIDLISDISDDVVVEVIDFIVYLKMKKEKNRFNDLVAASESGIDFWINDEDEEWNNV
jgi:arsenate reductase-like glutaredoxin family protein